MQDRIVKGVPTAPSQPERSAARAKDDRDVLALRAPADPLPSDSAGKGSALRHLSARRPADRGETMSPDRPSVVEADHERREASRCIRPDEPMKRLLDP